jgi:hypothetical protein
MNNKTEKQRRQSVKASRKICVICEKHYDSWGNNAEPVSQGECCDHCNNTVVIPARIMNIVEGDRDE